MPSRSTRLALLMLVCAGLTAGCAKRPAVATVAAPAPTGAAVTQAPAPPPPAVTPPAAPTPPPPQVAAPAPAAPVAPPAPPAPTPPPPPAQFREMEALKPIYFDFDRSDIRPDAARILDANIGWITSHPDAVILIEGHCDERGTDAYNIALGERRANATMSYLTARGVAASRITTISYGEERPSCTTHNEACWAKNRRAHFLTKGS